MTMAVKIPKKARGKAIRAARPASKPVPKRGTTEDEVLATAQAFGVALHRAGAMNTATMRDLDALCLPPRPEYGSSEVRRIRAAARMSQPVFARLLGVDKSAVAQWERGAKRPSGPAARLLEVLDPQQDDSPIVRVRHGMTVQRAGRSS